MFILVFNNNDCKIEIYCSNTKKKNIFGKGKCPILKFGFTIVHNEFWIECQLFRI